MWRPTMKKIRLVVLQLVVTVAALGAASADEAEKTRIGGYVDAVFLYNSGIGWSGSEAFFFPRVKLDITHKVNENALVRVSGEWQPTVSPYSRAYSTLKQTEGVPDDTYLEFSGLSENTTARFGVVKVPFGQFDTMAFNTPSRPTSFGRTRGWDYGFRLDRRFQLFDLSLAVVNGDGVTGTATQSDKTYVARIVFPAQTGEIYPETLEITNYPNPAKTNAGGDFGWSFGISGYNGTKYSTPIKIKASHYGADLRMNYSIFSLMTQYSLLEGGFTDPTMNNLSPADITALVSTFQYSSSVVNLLNGVGATYPRAQASVTELVAGLNDKTVVSVMWEYYEPDMNSDSTPQQMERTKFVFGVKHDFKENISLGAFYVKNHNPAFGNSGNIVETDWRKGDDIFMTGIATQF